MANQFAHGEDSITQASVETLMKRGLKPASDGKFTWSSDLRLRVPAAFSALGEQVLHYASRIRCPMLLLKVFSNFKPSRAHRVPLDFPFQTLMF